MIWTCLVATEHRRMARAYGYYSLIKKLDPSRAVRESRAIMEKEKIPPFGDIPATKQKKNTIEPIN